jgi:hypothetical protein
MDTTDEYDYESMSALDLEQLRELTNQSITYYNSILENETVCAKLKEADKLAFELCRTTMQEDMKKIDDELRKR